MPASPEQRSLYIGRLANCARHNDVAFAELARELAPMLGREVRRIIVPGADRDDVAQEALIALYLAVLAYDGERPFAPLGKTVVRRRLDSMLKTALRSKRHGAHDLQLDHTDEQDAWLGDAIADRLPGPFERVAQRERVRQVSAVVRELSPLERRALAGTLAGFAYEQLGPPKAIDNALQRARRRLREACA